MTSLSGKQAVVVGGSSGIGKATVRALLSEGARVTAVARGREGLHALGSGVATIDGDATNPEFVSKLLREVKPELVVLSAGVNPTMGPLDALDWNTFSEAWNLDVKATFLLLQEVLRAPLVRGSSVVIVSSGAALNGSPFSGGYAGAKRMQWWLADYAQRVSDQRTLGLRFATIVPEQLLVNTAIGTRAAATYGAMNGTTAEAFMKRYDAPLDAEKVAAGILQALRGEASSMGIKGTGTRPLA